MRERLKMAAHKVADLRITPAYAGKTLCCRANRVKLQDHPRVCGKDKSRLTRLNPILGSPPRMRERHSNRTMTMMSNRITPAYAGKT